ncbi:DUF2589 domain-containing protein [Brachyspira hampsonii]|uniref:Uncharacterized protein n=1 Tax=Brachyspira hampsonii 30446 TaxID=1289135 RepID=A0A2U4FKD4_9SPIR|nr:DUF2589 domain-containing protein [Brachyspira hampsonii]EKV57801.1 hypothetical protein A966_03393 [Brachyspira hampsonii 30446]MBW5390306.1 DUF2589 domain-containing protein [Brachyspira hampsonii]MBW5395035.1 DUF2589 domain-containing protein [Brachyspira hampsonii]OEJ20257.1 hypothetical protein A9495_12495 [Brachyspira hampsonii]
MSKFNEVIIAIAKSVAEAEAQLEEVQLSNLSKYFKKKRDKSHSEVGEYLPGIFPIRLKIGVPDENNKYGNKYYCVPYINLLPISQLNIDSVNASFDIGIVELIEPQKSTNKSVFNNVYDDDKVCNMSDFENSSNISVDVTGAGLDKCKGTTINVQVSISKTEISDGMSRLINEITNLSQGFIEVKDDKNDIHNDINN